VELAELPVIDLDIEEEDDQVEDSDFKE